MVPVEPYKQRNINIKQGYGFLTMLPSGDLLNFGLTGNDHLLMTTVCFWGRYVRKDVFQILIYGKLGMVRAH